MRIGWLLFLSMAGVVTATRADDKDALFSLSLRDLGQLRVSVASLSPEPLAQAPSTVALIKPEQWQRQGAHTVAEAVASQPGIWITPTNYGGQAVNMRGFFPSYRGVSTLLDGVAVNSFLDSSAFEDSRRWQLGTLSQIEMIRGPGSSLYGADALRGVMALTSWAGTDDASAEQESLRTSYGEAGQRLLQFHAGSATASGSLRAALAGQRQPEQNHVYHYTDPDQPASGIQHGRYRNELSNHMGVLGWKGHVGDSHTEIGLYTARNASEGTPSLGTALTHGLSVFKDRELSAQDRRFLMFRLKSAWSLANHPSECTVSRWRDEGVRELDRTRETSSQAYLATASDETKDFGQCLLRAQSEDRLQWLTGVEFSRHTMHQLLTRFYSEDQIPIGTLVYPSEGYSRYTRSLLLQGKYSLAHSNFVLGGRYDKFSDFDGHFSPRFGFNYFLTEHDTLKLMAGNAFLSPTAFQRFGSGLTVLAAPDLRAEEMNTYELAWAHYEDKHSYSLTLFLNQWKDAIVLMPLEQDNRLRVHYVNEEDSRSHGLEAQWQRVWDQFRMHLAYTYSRAENQNTELEYRGFPQHIVHLNLDYRLSPYPVSIGLHSTLANEFDMRNPSSADPHPPQAPNYVRVDLHANWNVDSRLALFADARNIANRANPVAGVFNQEFGIDDPGASVLLGMNLQW